MLWILGMAFGAVMLFFLMRKFVRHQTTLEEYRRMHEAAQSRAEKELHKELLTLPPSETLAPVAAGIREMLELHGTGRPFNVRNLADPPRVEVRLPERTLTIRYRLKPTGHVRSGCYWEVDTGDDAHVCRSLDAAMRRIERVLVEGGHMEHPLI